MRLPGEAGGVCLRDTVGLSLIAAAPEEPLEPELGDLVVPTDRVEQVDELAHLG
jgi:hypothetical protein